jgi:hypothetical protein
MELKCPYRREHEPDEEGMCKHCFRKLAIPKVERKPLKTVDENFVFAVPPFYVGGV